MDPFVLLFLFLFELLAVVVVILARIAPSVCENRIFLEVAFRACAVATLLWSVGAFATISLIPVDFVLLTLAVFFGFQTVRFYKMAKQLKFFIPNL